jgi:two-component system response regulator YesN
MYFRLPEGSGWDRATLDRYFPSWMTQAWHTLHLVGVLRDFTRFGCSVAPLLPVDCWAVLREASEAIVTFNGFIDQFQRADQRRDYNNELLTRTSSTLTTQIGSMWGQSDVYVPLISEGRCSAVIVAGSFLRAMPTERELGERWFELAGTPANSYDANLLAFARAVLSLDVLEPAELAAITELLEILARSLVGKADLPKDMDRVAELRETVIARMPAAIGRRAALMLGGATWNGWIDELDTWQRSELGIERYPNAVIALMPAEHETKTDPVSSLVTGLTFQRDCLKLRSRLEDTLAAPLDEYGSYFLFYQPPAKNAARARLGALEQAREIARLVKKELGIDVTMGVGGVASEKEGLAACARRAVTALQLAAHQEKNELSYDGAIDGRSGSTDAHPGTLLMRLTRIFAMGAFGEVESAQADYVRAVLVDSGGRISRIRMHLEGALDGALDELSKFAMLDAQTRSATRDELQGWLARASSVKELVSGFSNALGSLTRLPQNPRRGELELRLQRAARFIDENCHEPLLLSVVARKVGLSRNYFSEQFKAANKIGFSEYLCRARIDRAKHLLRSSPAAVQRVSAEAGFSHVAHFNRAFKRIVGVTPSRYRTRAAERPAPTVGVETSRLISSRSR